MEYSEEDLQEFKAEALEFLETAEKSILALDQGASEFKPAFDAIFRGFHNLKGAAGMIENPRLEKHTHELENILMQFKGAGSIPKEYLSLFLKGIDAARSLLDGKEVSFDYNVEKAETPAPAAPSAEVAHASQSMSDELPESAIQEFIAEFEEMIERMSKSLQLIETGSYSHETIESLYRDMHSLKGSSFLFGFRCLGDIAHAVESSLEPIRSKTHGSSQVLMNVIFKCIQVMEKGIAAVKAGQPLTETEQVVPRYVDMLAIAGNNLPKLDKASPPAPTPAPVKAAEAPVASAPIAPPSPVEKPLGIKEAKPEPTHSLSAETASAGPTKDGEFNGSIRVSVSLLDNLMTRVGEMVLVRNQVLQFSNKTEDPEFLDLSKRLSVVTAEIQGEMMKTRMQPIGNILSKFSRVVRDLSQELHKDISLSMVGMETELDRSLLEAIKDPLTHIIRNACDHGIESPEARINSGKSKTGTIKIRAYHEGGQIVIEVSDDGKGLHKDVLLKKALEKNIISHAQAASMSEKEIFNLIFAPGFSTAATITNVSGRGVGMDVVRTNVEKIGGSVDVNSAPGRGTTMQLKIPLTLAIIPALTVKSAGTNFAIPQVKLEELVRVEQGANDSKIEYLHGVPVFRLRGNILPLVSLNKVLGKPEKAIGPEEAINIAVVNGDQMTFGLIVDEVQDTYDIVVKPINRLLKSLKVYSGATILGDGSIALILDVQGIAKVAKIGMDAGKGDTHTTRRADELKSIDQQQYLMVKVNSPTKHVIVLGYVHRLEEFKPSDVEYSGLQRVIRYGSTVLPLISVDEQLRYGKLSAPTEQAILPVVVIKKAGVLYGLEVQEISDIFSTDSPVEAALVRQSGIFGNINTSQELIVAIDPYQIIETVFPEQAVRPVQSKAMSVAVEHAKPDRPLQILLVEDTAFFRKTIQSILQRGEHQITSAVDGVEALELLEKNPTRFDLVISDIEMPRMNGFDLARGIRANPKLAHLPLLAVSSRAEKDYTDEGIRAGFDYYLEKLKPDTLMGAVAKLISVDRRSA